AGAIGERGGPLERRDRLGEPALQADAGADDEVEPRAARNIEGFIVQRSDLGERRELGGAAARRPYRFEARDRVDHPPRVAGRCAAFEDGDELRLFRGEAHGSRALGAGTEGSRPSERLSQVDPRVTLDGLGSSPELVETLARELADAREQGEAATRARRRLEPEERRVAQSPERVDHSRRLRRGREIDDALGGFEREAAGEDRALGERELLGGGE